MSVAKTRSSKEATQKLLKNIEMREWSMTKKNWGQVKDAVPTEISADGTVPTMDSTPSPELHLLHCVVAAHTDVSTKLPSILSRFRPTQLEVSPLL